MHIRTGTYTGTGIERSITNLGITPDFVLVKRGTVAVPNLEAMFKFSTMASDFSTRLYGGGIYTDAIKSLFADGFIIGTNDTVNLSGAVHHWLAIELETADSKIITYTGDGADNRSIAGVGFQPDLVLLTARTTASVSFWRTSDMNGDNSQSLGSFLTTDHIQALEADGFQVGTDDRVNTDGVAYNALCLKNVASKLKVLTYTGDGSAGKSITGAGFAPNFALTKTEESAMGVLRYASHTGAYSNELDAVEQTNRITAFEADGFEVGSVAEVNKNGTVYHAVVMDAIVSEGGSAMSLPIIIA